MLRPTPFQSKLKIPQMTWKLIRNKLSKDWTYSATQLLARNLSS